MSIYWRVYHSINNNGNNGTGFTAGLPQLGLGRPVSGTSPGGPGGPGGPEPWQVGSQIWIEMATYIIYLSLPILSYPILSYPIPSIYIYILYIYIYIMTYGLCYGIWCLAISFPHGPSPNFWGEHLQAADEKLSGRRSKLSLVQKDPVIVLKQIPNHNWTQRTKNSVWTVFWNRILIFLVQRPLNP